MPMGGKILQYETRSKSIMLASDEKRLRIKRDVKANDTISVYDNVGEDDAGTGRAREGSRYIPLVAQPRSVGRARERVTCIAFIEVVGSVHVMKSVRLDKDHSRVVRLRLLLVSIDAPNK